MLNMRSGLNGALFVQQGGTKKRESFDRLRINSDGNYRPNYFINVLNTFPYPYLHGR
jgi:hypothetical protein